MTVSRLAGGTDTCVSILGYSFPPLYVQLPLVRDCVDVPELLKQNMFKIGLLLN